MLIVERQQRLIDILQQRRSAQLEDLAQALGVSPSTVRRDLDTLVERGLVDRTHGGAILRDTPGPPEPRQPTLIARMTDRLAEKQAIGRAAASLVQPHMTVLLDGGSTVIYAARQITARPLQVVTNSLMIATDFAEDEQVELILVGGTLYPRTGVTVGAIATGTLADLHADLMFFSLAGVYGDAGFNLNLEMAQVEQAMMRQAAECVMLMDSSKFGRKSLVRVCGVEQIDRIITDDGVDAEFREALGDRLVTAPTG
ncbi:MAG: DeoR/GlpR family DNA-binding transcription regulator [Planctomycetota bacterium]